MMKEEEDEMMKVVAVEVLGPTAPPLRFLVRVGAHLPSGVLAQVARAGVAMGDVLYCVDAVEIEETPEGANDSIRDGGGSRGEMIRRYYAGDEAELRSQPVYHPRR